MHTVQCDLSLSLRTHPHTCAHTHAVYIKPSYIVCIVIADCMKGHALCLLKSITERISLHFIATRSYLSDKKLFSKEALALD